MSACPETWIAARTALAVESLHRCGWLRLQVHGLSMLPSLWPGDEVEIVRCSPANLKRGHVVLGIRNGNFILHRLLGFSRNGEVVTRGDAMPSPDPAVPADEILGTVVKVIRGGRSIAVLRQTPLQRSLGLLLCYSGFARVIALRFHNWRNHEKVRQLQIDRVPSDRELLQMAQRQRASSLQPELVKTR